MSPGKELLLSCIVMMHISFMASRPVELDNLPENQLENLQKNLKTKLRMILLPCQDLRRAENSYIKEMFSEQPPSGLNTLVQGITMGNTIKEINTSTCAISKYLGNHMKKIVSDTLTSGPTKDDILDEINNFITNFKAAAGVNTMQCDVASLEPHDYQNKILGCRILSSVRQWVEHFAHSTCTPSVH